MTLDLPEIGTKVVVHRTHRPPIVGVVVPRDTWETDDLAPDAFVVKFEFDDYSTWYSIDDATQTEKVVHIDP